MYDLLLVSLLQIMLPPLKKLAFILSLFLFAFSASAQENSNISFSNDYKDVYHLSLIIYTPDGKMQTRVSILAPNEI